MTTEQRSPVNNATVTFWVPMVVVVHRFDCELHISYLCMFGSNAARIRTAIVWDFCSWCTLNLDVATNLAPKCLDNISLFQNLQWISTKDSEEEKRGPWNYKRGKHNKSNVASTVCFTDLGKLNRLWWLDFKLEPIFAIALVVFKNNHCYKSGQNWPKNNHLVTVILICETDCTVMRLLKPSLKLFLLILNSS